ncbi:MAG: PulJ/GspJ family protein [Actinomycetota bacterium]
MKTRGGDERGITIVELMITLMIFTIVIAAASATLISAQRTTGLATSESDAVDVARSTGYQIQHDIRNAMSVQGCSPIGYCLQLQAQDPNGSVEFVQLLAQTAGSETSIVRESQCNGTFTSCSVSNTLVTNLQNIAQNKPVFQCPGGTTLGRVDVSMIVTPLSSSSSGTLTVQTSGRVRNANYPVTC